MPLMGILAEVSTDPTNVADAVKTVVDAGTSAFNFGTIAQILGVAIGAAAGLFLLWWGARKGLRMLKNAFSKGKLSI